MPYFDTALKQAVAYSINVDNSTGGKVSVTILKINRRDKLASADQLTVAPGVRTTLTDTAASNIDRVIIQFHPLTGNSLGVEVKQGAISLPVSCNGDTDVVFETVP